MTDVTEEKEPQSGVPLRGLAMVLIAVAVLFGLWGLYSLTQGEDSERNSAASSTTTSALETSAPASASAESEAQAEAPASSSEVADAGEGEASASTEADPAPAVAEQPVRVNVLNNSTVPGIAEETYHQLRDTGWEVGDHGNLPEQTGVVVPVTTVYFQPGDAAGQAEAERLAAEVNANFGVPVEVHPVDPGIPAEHAQPGQITLVLMGPLY